MRGEPVEVAKRNPLNWNELSGSDRDVGSTSVDPVGGAKGTFGWWAGAHGPVCPEAASRPTGQSTLPSLRIWLPKWGRPRAPATERGWRNFAASGDPPSTPRLVRFEPFFGAAAGQVPPINHVDRSVFGALPLELYIQTGQVPVLWCAPQRSYED